MFRLTIAQHRVYMGNDSLCHDLEAGKGAATSLLIAVHATALVSVSHRVSTNLLYVYTR